jgi:hypothetical protein
MLILVFAAVPVSMAETPRNASLDSVLSQTFDLAARRLPQPQYYRMETTLVAYGPDGKPTGTDTFCLLLNCVPGKDADEYTCRRFTWRQGEGPDVRIPALDGWSYAFKTGTGFDEKGQVLGIDHAKFEGLVGSNGLPLPTDKAYKVYNTFIDFHAFCNTFAEPTQEEGGIQDLTRIGQRIVHASAFSEPPVELGSNIGEGSTFRNGEVTLEFKGLSHVDRVPCALVGFDSGQSSFTMFMEPMPNMKITTEGGSHYLGDIYIDLRSRWVRKVVMSELVVSETRLPMPPSKLNVVHERNTIIRSVTAEAFSRNSN